MGFCSNPVPPKKNLYFLLNSLISLSLFLFLADIMLAYIMGGKIIFKNGELSDNLREFCDVQLVI